MEVSYDFDELKEVVEGNDGIEQHEEGFGNFKNVFHLARRSWLKISYAVVTNISYGPSRKWWQNEAWYNCFSVLRKLFLEDWQGVTFGAMTRTSSQYLPWICRGGQLLKC